ncbi:hypothetical protein J1N35_028233 [Gossypium stocksii]|uniref:Disease resistance protein At4g27190-like leucine-rich repeats domain-containing protein n=1 Tax=Gossypium stocksii TaxID=47602 RepID=A0A9D3ZQX2_9ROSI|nr:hypothetical protein J1N35_028233 [Gossypium stocksii]
MEFLIDITKDQGSTIAFSNLMELNIKSMDSLKGLCYGLSPSYRAIASFTRLKVVTIKFCYKLKTIFSPCLAQSMLCIEELYVSDCNRLEQVIGFAQEEEIIKNDSHLYCCPKLRILYINSCGSLKYVCANTWTQGLQSLESIQIIDCPQLMQIFNMEQNENEEDVMVDGIDVSNMKNHYPQLWPKLETVDIRKCKNLKYLCSSPLAEGLPHLESIKIEVCPRLVQVLVLSNVGNSCQLLNVGLPVLNEDCIVVGNHEEVFQVQNGCSFSRIKKLYLRNLFEVQIIWKDFAQVVTLENLTTLKLSGCKKLRYIFSPTTARSLSHLVNLFIEGCEEIEQLILAKDQVSSSSSNGDTSLQPISFPNLTKIIVTK